MARTPETALRTRTARITIPEPTGKFVDGGHQDWGAYSLNTGVDLRRNNQLGVNHSVIGTPDVQPLQADVPSTIGRVKALVGAAFVAPIAEGDFAPTRPDRFLAEHARHDQVYTDAVASHDAMKDVRTVEDLFGVVHNEEQVGLMRSVEGLYVNEENYQEAIDALKERGVVSVGIMWNFDTEVGCTTAVAVRKDKEDTGLSEFGRNVVKYLDEKDMLVDVSHASDKTIEGVLDVLKDGKNPPIATHSGSRAVHEHNRNLKDEFAVEIVERGGVIGLPFVDTFIGPKGDSSADRVVDHIQHFKDLGILHGVMLGTDFNGMANTSVIPGLEDVSKVQENLTSAMRKKGFSQEEIDMVFYGNALDFWLKHLPSQEPQGKRPPVTEDVFVAAPTPPQSA